MKKYIIFITMLLITPFLSSCYDMVEEKRLECERLVSTHLDNSMCDNFDMYKSSGNGDVNTGRGMAQKIAIANCQKARACIGILESKYEKALWTNRPDTASPYQQADGEQEGSIVIEIKKDISSLLVTSSNQEGNALATGAKTVANAILDAISKHKDKLDTTFTVEAKQGKFTKTNTNKITFTLRDFLKLKGVVKLGYQTYDCHDSTILNKDFETFTIGANTPRGIVKLREFLSPFRCEDYFTITTTLDKRTTGERSRPPNTMIEGPNTLTSKSKSGFTSKQLMYVNSAEGVVTLFPLKDEASSYSNGSFYQFSNKSCSYERKTSSSTNESLNDSLASLKHHNIGLVDDDKAIIEFGIKRKFKDKLIVNWKALRSSGSWSKQYSYHKNYGDDDNDIEIPAELKNLQKFITAGIAEGSKNSHKMSEMILETLPLTEKDNCHVRRFTDIWDVGKYKRVDDEDYSISISPATRSEIKLFKAAKDSGDYRYHRASKPPVEKLSNYEKEPNSLLDTIQNSTYNQLSKSEKKAWDKTADLEQSKIDSKKAEAEFNNASFESLEMFTE